MCVWFGGAIFSPIANSGNNPSKTTFWNGLLVPSSCEFRNSLLLIHEILIKCLYKPKKHKIALSKTTCPLPLFESVWVLLYLAMSEVWQILHRGNFAPKEGTELSPYSTRLSTRQTLNQLAYFGWGPGAGCFLVICHLV